MVAKPLRVGALVALVLGLQAVVVFGLAWLHYDLSWRALYLADDGHPWAGHGFAANVFGVCLLGVLFSITVLYDILASQLLSKPRLGALPFIAGYVVLVVLIVAGVSVWDGSYQAIGH